MTRPSSLLDWPATECPPDRTAIFRPDLELLARLRATQVNVARFLGRSYTQPSPTVARFLQDQFQPVADRLFPLLEQALPAVEPHELRLRFGLIIPVITGLFATATVPGHTHLLGSDDIEEQLNVLLTFFAPALAARPALEPYRKDGL